MPMFRLCSKCKGAGCAVCDFSSVERHYAGLFDRIRSYIEEDFEPIELLLIGATIGVFLACGFMSFIL